jgi:hypothetical protein
LNYWRTNKADPLLSGLVQNAEKTHLAGNLV